VERILVSALFSGRNFHQEDVGSVKNLCQSYYVCRGSTSSTVYIHWICYAAQLFQDISTHCL
jgi:hypothetical protein